MANARPVVATDVGGVVDLVGAPHAQPESTPYSIRDRGMLVPSGDADAFRAALERLVGDADLQRDMGERGRQFVVQNYSRERLVDDIARLYEKLAGVRCAAHLRGSRSALMDSTLG